MKDQFKIEELLKSKLEGLEETPSAQVWEKTARTLRRKQFWQFRPGRMNIFYVAGLVVLGGLLTVLITDKEPKPGDHEVMTTDTFLTQPESFEQQVISEDATDSNIEAQNHQEIIREVQQEDNRQNTETKATTEHGLTASDDKTIVPTINNEPFQTLVAYFIPSVTEGCSPLTVELINTSINAVSYDWNTIGDVKEGSNDEAVVTFEEPGRHTVTLIARDANGLTRSHSDQIIVHPKPTAEFEISEGNIFNYSTGAVAYSWESLTIKGNELSSDFQPPVNGFREGDSIMLIAANIYGCKDSTTRVLPIPTSPTLVFPTAFSPNPAGPSGGNYNPNEPNNRVFHPVYEEQPFTYNLKIFNKTGELIFETDEIETGWDGYYKESPAPRGVYIYHCTGTWLDGTSFRYRGDVTLLQHNP